MSLAISSLIAEKLECIHVISQICEHLTDPVGHQREWNHMDFQGIHGAENPHRFQYTGLELSII
jgi:hypothetical protein